MVSWRWAVREERGQGLVEYALILFFMAVVVVVALSMIGPQVGSMFSSVYVAFGE